MRAAKTFVIAKNFAKIKNLLEPGREHFSAYIPATYANTHQNLFLAHYCVLLLSPATIRLLPWQTQNNRRLDFNKSLRPKPFANEANNLKTKFKVFLFLTICVRWDTIKNYASLMPIGGRLPFGP